LRVFRMFGIGMFSLFTAYLDIIEDFGARYLNKMMTNKEIHQFFKEHPKFSVHFTVDKFLINFPT